MQIQIYTNKKRLQVITLQSFTCYSVCLFLAINGRKSFCWIVRWYLV